MGRIRSLKPEMPMSQSFGRLSRDARLLFIELWTACDDYGRCRAALPLLAGTLFPYDDDARGLIGGWMDELIREDMVVVYNVAGCDYLQVVNWAKHQRVDNAGKSNIPPPPEEVRRDSPRTAANVGEPPRLAAGLDGTKEGNNNNNNACARENLSQILHTLRIYDVSPVLRGKLVEKLLACGFTVDMVGEFQSALVAARPHDDDVTGLMVRLLDCDDPVKALADLKAAIPANPPPEKPDRKSGKRNNYRRGH